MNPLINWFLNADMYTNTDEMITGPVVVGVHTRSTHPHNRRRNRMLLRLPLEVLSISMIPTSSLHGSPSKLYFFLSLYLTLKISLFFFLPLYLSLTLPCSFFNSFSVSLFHSAEDQWMSFATPGNCLSLNSKLSKCQLPPRLAGD